jgi:hypothetical protein
VPYGTDLFCKRIPGSKLPGYDHLVPSGQKAFLRPFHKIDSTSLPPFENEDDDEDENDSHPEPANAKRQLFSTWYDRCYHF